MMDKIFTGMEAGAEAIEKNFDSLSTLSNQNDLKTRNYLKDASIKDTVDYKTARVRFTRVGNVCTVHIYAALLTDKGWNKLVSCPPGYMPAYSGAAVLANQSYASYTCTIYYSGGSNNYFALLPGAKQGAGTVAGQITYITNDDYPIDDIVK